MAITCTFEPSSENKLLPNGHVCQFRVKSAEETIGKISGDDQFSLRIECLADGGEVETTLPAWITFSDNDGPKRARNAFLESVGLSTQAGEQIVLSTENLVGKAGRVRLKQAEWNGDLKNEVSWWLKPEESSQPY